MANEPITLRNVHKLTAFELRQELSLRGFVFDDSHHKGVVNYNFLLEKMVQELSRADNHSGAACSNDNDANDHNQDQDQDLDQMDSAQALKMELERKKRERKWAAVERSQRRQAEQGYFMDKLASNRQHMNSQASISVPSETNTFSTWDGNSSSLEPNEKDGSEHVPTNQGKNPLRLAFRPKIGGRAVSSK